MAENCIFCGKAVSFWTSSPLTCGGVEQPACSECAEQYGREPMLQRARLALDTGRAREPEKLMVFIDQESQRQQGLEERKRAREEQLKKAREGRSETTRCCGFEMVREGQYTFTDQTPFALRMFPAYTPTLMMFRCEVCGQIKLFDASFFSPEEGGTEPEREPEEPVACPVCGTKHSPQIGCPACAAQERRPQPSQAPKEPKPFKLSRSGKKPPWEK